MRINPKEYVYPNGKIHTRNYLNAEGQLHRDPLQGPAYEVWHENGQKTNQQYFVDGVHHRDPSQGPAIKHWDESGKNHSENYYVDGKEVPKPEAKVESKTEVKPEEKFFPNGKIYSRIYRNTAGLYHRDPLKGPACEYWDENGQKWYQQYIVDGDLHRDPDEGPAYECWNKDGSKFSEGYWLDGIEVQKLETSLKQESDLQIKNTEDLKGSNSKLFDLSTVLSIMAVAVVGAYNANKDKKLVCKTEVNNEVANHIIRNRS